MYNRKCPKCHKKLVYKFKSQLILANNKNQKCKKCYLSFLKKNPSFFGKHHSSNTKEILKNKKTKYHYNVGDQINNFTITANLGRKEKYGILWQCKCICGTIFERYNYEIHLYKGCGCSRDITKCAYLTNTVFGYIKRRAEKSKIEFNLTKEYLNQLFIDQNFKCAISKLPIQLTHGRYNSNKTASLDRIDSTKGYVEGNVWWTHKYINIMKNSHSMEMFVQLCKIVVENYGSSVVVQDQEKAH